MAVTTTPGTRQIARSLEVDAHRLEQEAKALRSAARTLRGRPRKYQRKTATGRKPK